AKPAQVREQGRPPLQRGRDEVPAVDRVLELERAAGIRAERERRVPLDARWAAGHYRPLHVVAEPPAQHTRRPPIALVGVDRAPDGSIPTRGSRRAPRPDLVRASTPRPSAVRLR